MLFCAIDILITYLNLNDLAIRSARIKEVRMAINNSSIGKQKGPVKILMLTGPFGCGKSTLIRLISKTDGYKLIEWLPSRWAYDDNRAYNTQHSSRIYIGCFCYD
ncbi:unnamed protein product [Rhizopus microsporus]